MLALPLNLFRAQIDWSAFSTKFTVWSHRFPDKERMAYSRLPALVSAFVDGRLQSCHLDTETRTVFALVSSAAVGGDPGMSDMRRVDNPARKLPAGLALTLLLRGPSLGGLGMGTIRGFSGSMPILDHKYDRESGDADGNTPQNPPKLVLKVAVEWVASPVTADGEEVFAVTPHCHGYRTNIGQWETSRARKVGAAFRADDREHFYVFRKTSGGYVEVPGGGRTAWRDGDLVLGAAVRDSKESDLHWASATPSLQRHTKSAALARLPGIVADGLPGILRLDPLESAFQDRRIAPVGTTMGKLTDLAERIRGNALHGKTIVVIDARIGDRAAAEDCDKLRRAVAKAQFRLGNGGDKVEFRRLSEAAADGSGDLAARMRAVIGGWNAADGSDVLWLCVVDDKDKIRFLPGKIDTKRLIYKECPGRVIQSLHNPDVLAMKPAKKAVEDADPPSLKAILIAIALKVELVDRRLRGDRAWSASAQHYVFFASAEDGDGQRYCGALWLAGSEIHYADYSDIRKAVAAHAGTARRAVICDPATAVGVPEGVIEIRVTPIRLMPPAVESLPDGVASKTNRVGWGKTLGVSVFPSLGCYSASQIGNWNGGMAKGVVLRRVLGGEPADLTRMADMCLDASVRLNQTTVIPAPFKMLREISEFRLFWGDAWAKTWAAADLVEAVTSPCARGTGLRQFENHADGRFMPVRARNTRPRP